MKACPQDQPPRRQRLRRAGTIGAVPAFVHAVLDALHERGVLHLEMPLTPEEGLAGFARSVDAILTGSMSAVMPRELRGYRESRAFNYALAFSLLLHALLLFACRDQGCEAAEHYSRLDHRPARPAGGLAAAPAVAPPAPVARPALRPAPRLEPAAPLAPSIPASPALSREYVRSTGAGRRGGAQAGPVRRVPSGGGCRIGRSVPAATDQRGEALQALTRALPWTTLGRRRRGAHGDRRRRHARLGERETGSGHEVLDSQALEMFKRAKPLVPIRRRCSGRSSSSSCERSTT